jgi:sugar lactone lactonase YvrE
MGAFWRRNEVSLRDRRIPRLTAGWRALSGALILVAAILALTGGASAEPTCTDTWTGTTGDGLWQTAGNWSTASVPNSSDVACIGSGTTVKITEGSNKAGSLQDEGSLEITGGLLELMDSSTMSSVNSLALDGGTLTGAGSVTVSSAFSLGAYSTMSGSGETILGSGVSGTIEAPTGCEPMSLNERAFVNEGTLTFTWGTLLFSGGAWFENKGTFVDNSQEGCDPYPIGPLVEGDGDAQSFINTGTFESEGSTVGIGFDNEGVVKAQRGALDFTSGGVPGEAAYGSWSVEEGGSLVFAKGTFWIGEAVDLSSVEVTGATVVRKSTGEALRGALEPLPYVSGTVKVSGHGRSTGSAFAGGTIEITPAGKSEWETLCGPLSPDGVGRVGCSWNTKVEAYPDGSYQLRAKLSDSSTPPDTVQTSPITVVVDNTPPTGTLASLASSINGTVTLEGEANDSGSDVATWTPQITTAGAPEWVDACPAQSTPVSGTTYQCSLDTTEYPSGPYEFRAVIVDNAGNTYTTSAASSAIDNPDTTSELSFSSEFGSEGSGDGQFVHPADVAVGSGGNVWVVDQANDRVEEFSEKGEYLSQFGSEGSGDGQFKEPAGIAVDPEGNIWVLDTGNSRVQEFNDKGEHLKTIGSEGIGAGQFEYPEGIAIDSHGNVWVADAYSGNVEEFNKEGEYVKTIGTEGSGSELLKEPNSLAVDSHGNVWVVEWADSVVEYNEKGEYLRRFGAEGRGNGKLKVPFGIAIDPSGDVWVGDTLNNRIEEFSEKGEYVSQFGAGGAGEGQFKFSSPIGLAFTESGAVWIADSGNSRVEEWVPVASAPSNTVAPGVIGAPYGEVTLSANPGTWTGSPRPSYSYQWQRCNTSGGECVNITGATSHEYALGESDVGMTVRVVVTAENSHGSATASSSPTTTIAAATAPSNATVPAISGTAQDGHTLTASAGTWAGDPPTSYNYQWQSCNSSGESCANISGATNSTYVLTSSDVGKTVRVVVSASNSAGSTSSGSEATEVVKLVAPSDSSLPAISGTAMDGQTLTASTGTWTGGEPFTYTYQWQSCDSSGGSCADISGATSATYMLGHGDFGTTLRVIVTAENAAGSESSRSEATAVIAPAPPLNTIKPAISGEIIDGAALSAGTGTWTGTPSLSYSYQWQSCNSSGGSCASISGATSSTYTLGHSDVGTTLRVVVKATNSGGSASATSEASGVVAARKPSNTTAPSISGETKEGYALSASAGTWEGTPTFTYTYQWQSCNSSGSGCANISGGTSSTYSLTSSNVGSTLRVVVKAENSAGSANATSAASSIVTGAPMNTAAPEISGTSEEGQTFSTSTGSWRAYPAPTYTYQWQACKHDETECTNIEHATESTYTLLSADVGKAVRVIVTATNSAGSSSAASIEAEVVKPTPPVSVTPPTISGVAREEQLFTAHLGEWSGGQEGTVFTYQWESCDGFGEGCIAIVGATGSTYLLTPTDVATTLRVVVTATALDLASATSTSAATSVIEPGSYYGVQFGSMGSSPGQFKQPADVALAKGDIWVLDSVNDRVEKFNEAGEYLNEFGSEGSSEGQLKKPVALAIDSKGDVWILDAGNKRVEEFNEAGEYVSQFSLEEVALGGIAIREGDLWISNTGSGTLGVYNEAGELLKTVGSHGSGTGQLGEPEGLAINSAGEVWVADWSNNRIEEFTESGEYVKEFGSKGSGEGQMHHPYGLAVGPGSEIWVGEVGNDRVQAFSEGGEYLGMYGSEGSGAGQLLLSHPLGVAVNSKGAWITDAGNYRVDEWLMPSSTPSNTASPSVSGETVEGRTLSTSTGTWTGAPSRYTYQWQRCNTSGSECVNIEGARSQTYTLAGADVSKTARAVVSATNASGSTSATSTATSVISSATAPSNTAVPTISGAVHDGGTLSASTGTWSGTPASSYAYQWKSCNSSGEECAAIEGATTAEYALGEGDIGTTVRVEVTDTNAAGSAHATSAASTKVTAEPPGELEAPLISGTPDEYQVLYAHPGAWTGTERQFSYQWESCNSSGAECSPVVGATEPEYDLGEGDVSTTVRVRIGVNSALGALTDVSPVTPEIGAAGALASTVAPSITGTREVAHVLTASHGTWSDSATLSYSYQWQRCSSFGLSCANITGATSSSYTLTSSDAGHAVLVKVTASDGTHSLARTSLPTQPVAAEETPVDEQPPLSEGPSLQGSTLTATEGQWSGEGSISYSYQWQRCNEAGECTSISGATSSSYTLTESDVGSMLRILVTATNGHGSSEALSTATARIDPESLLKFSSPSIAGVIEIGSELEADPGIWSGSGPVSYSYQWERCNSHGEECAPIEGATEAGYKLVEGDHAHTLRVEITAKGPLGSESAYSATTAAAPGGEVTVEQAEEAAQETDPAVFDPSTTATLDGETIAPALSNEGQLFSEHALTSSSISKEDPGEFAVNTPDGELSLKPMESSAEATMLPTLVNGTVALFANTSPATDTIIRPNALGATTVLNLRSAEAPTSFSWQIGLGAGQRLKQLSDGSVVVVSTPESSSEPEVETSNEPESRGAPEDATESSEESAEKELEEKESETEVPIESPSASPESSTTPGEAPSGELEPQKTLAQYEAATSAMSAAEADVGTAALMVIQPPQVIDAHGSPVPASLSVREDTITLTIKPSETATYPILAAMPVAAPSDKVSGERDPFEYGLADEKPINFTNPNVTQLESSKAPLDIQTARITVPWNLLDGYHSGEVARLNEWLEKVEANPNHLMPYITLRSNYAREEPNVPKYREAVRKILDQYKGKVKRWGAWNEPDLGVFHALPERAGHYWQAATSAAVELHCGCTIVAGEFAQYQTNSENTNKEGNRVYAGKYRKGLLTYFAPAWEYKHKKNRRAWVNNKTPSTWGLHDYADVVNLRSTNASEFEQFASGGKLGRPRIWISEAGVELHDSVKGAPPTRLMKENDEPYEYEQQSKAANAFLALRYALAPHEKISRIERVYYYTFEAPTEAKVEENANEFDSGLFEAKPENKGKSYGEARPAYCFLAYENHDCPPTVVTHPEDEHSGDAAASVNPHGLATSAEFTVSFLAFREGKEKLETGGSTVSLGPGVIHPRLILGPRISCIGPSYKYNVIATSAGGKGEGKTIEGSSICV